MLSFLRKLRRNNMNSKYLKYAFGEIILVVIGILIALGINNWNGEKKEREFEKRMLSELQIALESDIKTFYFFDKVLKDWNKSVLYLTDAVNSKDISILNKDSVYYHLKEIQGFGVYVTYKTGPYESIRSSGLDKISNDTLRGMIAKLYGGDLPSLDIWVNEIIRGSINEKFRLFDELFDSKIRVEENSLEHDLIIENLNFLKDPRFIDILIKSSSAINNSIMPFQNNREQMEELRDLIKKEIE